MAGSFIFVDGLQNDRPTKRLMRRHVMQGKNAGKTIHRPSRMPPGQLFARMKSTVGEGNTVSPVGSPVGSSVSSSLSSPGLSSTDRIGAAWASLTTPVAMTSYAWGIINDCMPYSLLTLVILLLY